jgi:hypothetical protein
MSDFTLQIDDSSETFKKFSVIRKKSYFSLSYFFILVLSTAICLYMILGQNDIQQYIYISKFQKLGLILIGTREIK